MKKPTMLYASPFWPVKSGISNYSSCLLNALKRYYDITLLADGYRIEDPELRGFPVVRHRKKAVYRNFDVILYNIGNQPDYHGYMVECMERNPGYIILHDFSLYYLSIGVAQKRDCVFETIYAEAGVNGIQLVKDSLRTSADKDLLHHKWLADQLPLNRGIIAKAKGMFVHSDFTKRCVRQLGTDTDLWKINHLTTFDIHMSGPDEAKRACERIKERWEIPEDAFMIASAGFIAPSKQNQVICQAVEQYNAGREDKIYYLMIGEGEDADSYLGRYCKKTGFVPNELYQLAIERADMIFNLRYPTNGETSGTLIQAMQMGKPCVTTAIGWFDELPDDTVIKVEPTAGAKDLAALLENRDAEYLNALGKRASEYVMKECNPEKIAEEIFHCLSAAEEGS